MADRYPPVAEFAPQSGQCLHFCVGAVLAEMGARVALEEVLER